MLETTPIVLPPESRFLPARTEAGGASSIGEVDTVRGWRVLISFRDVDGASVISWPCHWG